VVAGAAVVTVVVGAVEVLVVPDCRTSA